MIVLYQMEFIDGIGHTHYLCDEQERLYVFDCVEDAMNHVEMMGYSQEEVKQFAYLDLSEDELI